MAPAAESWTLTIRCDPLPCLLKCIACPAFSRPAPAGKVAKSQMAASQIDWRAMQQSQTERWLKCARRAFSGESLWPAGCLPAPARSAAARLLAAALP